MEALSECGLRGPVPAGSFQSTSDDKEHPTSGHNTTRRGAPALQSPWVHPTPRAGVWKPHRRRVTATIGSHTAWRWRHTGR